MLDIVLCVCGWLHAVQIRFHGTPIVDCPNVPPERWFLVNSDRLPPAQIHIPRPETVW